MPMTIQQCLQEATEKLKAVADNPHLEAELLLAHVLNKSRSFLHAFPETLLTENSNQQFQHDIVRRSQQEPVAYLLGEREFWSLNLTVTTDTLIPRPETEVLVEAILNLIKPHAAPLQIADLGTGCGTIALALAKERPEWQLTATDISQNALAIASKNAQRLELNNISFYQGNWLTALPRFDYDVIVSNPPYIAETEWNTYAASLRFEPRFALVSGRDGLEAIRIISATAKDYLKPLGYLFFEHGYLQGAAVRSILTVAGYQKVQTISDLAGLDRVTFGQKA